MANGQTAATGASSYSTGGGGTVLEHRYGAVLLASLLLNDPVAALGDDVVPEAILFQASLISPVDDLVVIGRAPDGSERWLSIGVRRAPGLSASDTASAELLASYLRIVTEQWARVRSGHWKLALAVAGWNPAAKQLQELARFAREAPDEASFRAAVKRPSGTNERVRSRLVAIDALVSEAATSPKVTTECTPEELTWRVLHQLSVLDLRLEGVDGSDRTETVRRLRAIVPDGSVDRADALFTRLVELSDRYAPAEARVTETLLRRDLQGVVVDRNPTYAAAWRVLDSLSEDAESDVRFSMANNAHRLELPRTEVSKTVARAMAAAGTEGSALVVTGEPDVGKSALVVREALRMREAQVAVTVLNLRHLPASLDEFEARLQARLSSVLGASAVGGGRLLVIDGAEAVLEGRDRMLKALARAAAAAGLGLIAVTRADGASSVEEILRQVFGGEAVPDEGDQALVRQCKIPVLDPIEVRQLLARFPELGRWADDERARWLFSRLGLVELLLRAGPDAAVPDGAVSEAHLFNTVWGQLVRQGERWDQGRPSPDARDQALRSLASRELLPSHPTSPDPDALPSLRSDGLLAPVNPSRTWNQPVQFASDLVRDMALTYVLAEQMNLLAEAAAPRWSIRAARIACQTRLLDAADARRALRDLQAEFDQIATGHGARWSEVPLEAALTLGTAKETLEAAWPDLTAAEFTGLKQVIRLATQRYATGEVADPVVFAPLVELLLLRDDTHKQVQFDWQLKESVQKVVLMWLRGLASRDTGASISLRQRVRDRILDIAVDQKDEFVLEALAMLGPDLDERAQAHVKRACAERGFDLAAVVENPWAVVMMARFHPDLLLDTAESYYIEQYDLVKAEGGWYDGALEEGIRHHSRYGGFGAPMAGWYFGPFWHLLAARPVPTLAMINRMLDHAAAIRVRGHHPDTVPLEEMQGLPLDLPGVGTRHCVGDGHVWSWYRGSSVGPYPCMSALLAVERFADQLVAEYNMPLHLVAELLLRECHNVAMPALVVGLFVRHGEKAGSLIDVWLRQPAVWEAEFERFAHELSIHVQGPDDADLVGRQYRRSTLRDVALEATVKASATHDQARLDELAAVADEMVRRAQVFVPEDADVDEAEHFLATVENWAAVLRPENHRYYRAEGGIVVECEPPEPVATILRPATEASARTSEAYRLLNTYATSSDRSGPVDTLLADVAVAQAFMLDPPDGVLSPMDPIAAVAASAAVANASGRIELPSDELRWTVTMLAQVAQPQHQGSRYHASSMYELGADRSAAIGLPALLAVDTVRQLDTRKILEGMTHSATSYFDDVRLAFARAVTRVWSAPCNDSPETSVCRHKAAFTAIEAGVRDCCFGDWDPNTGSRADAHLTRPYGQALAQVQAERFNVPRLIPALIATTSAAASGSCIAGEASQLAEALLTAHARAADHWTEAGYNNRSHIHAVRVLTELAIQGNPGPLHAHVQQFSANPHALHGLFEDMATLFTYSDEIRPHLNHVWAPAMETALDAIDEDGLRGDYNWRDYAIAALLPAPQIKTSDTDIDATLAHARANWIDPDTLADLVNRWIPIAHGEPKALDALAQLAKCAPLTWQRATGLAWAERLADDAYHAIASRCWFLTDWLTSVYSREDMTSDQVARWRRFVDGLAAAGDDRATALQRSEELLPCESIRSATFSGMLVAFVMMTMVDAPASVATTWRSCPALTRPILPQRTFQYFLELRFAGSLPEARPTCLPMPQGQSPSS